MLLVITGPWSFSYNWDLANACVCASLSTVITLCAGLFLVVRVALCVVRWLGAPWLLPARCQEHSSSSDKQRCLQTLSSVLSGVGFGE